MTKNQISKYDLINWHHIFLVSETKQLSVKLCILSNYRYGHDKVAKLLIERGASVTQINSNGYNPLVMAILYGKRYDNFNRQSQGNLSRGIDKKTVKAVTK